MSGPDTSREAVERLAVMLADCAEVSRDERLGLETRGVCARDTACVSDEAAATLRALVEEREAAQQSAREDADASQMTASGYLRATDRYMRAEKALLEISEGWDTQDIDLRAAVNIARAALSGGKQP